MILAWEVLKDLKAQDSPDGTPANAGAWFVWEHEVRMPAPAVFRCGSKEELDLRLLAVGLAVSSFRETDGRLAEYLVEEVSA